MVARCCSSSSIFLILFRLWSVCSQENVSLNDLSGVFDVQSATPVDYWFNFDFINEFTKSIVVIEGRNNLSVFSDESYRLRDFQTNLIKHLNNRHALPLMLLKPSTVLNMTQVREIMKFMQKEVFIMIYNNFESLEMTIERRLYVYTNYNRAEFLFVITLTELPNITCNNEEESVYQKLKDVTAKYFEIYWMKFGMIEVILLFPYLCGKEFLVTCDAINTPDNINNYKDGMIVVTKDTLDSETFKLTHRYKDFQGYPLKINLFPRIPTVAETMPKSFMETYLRNDIKQTGDIGGMDGMLLGNLVKRLNFTPIIDGPTDKTQSYGYLINGTITGSLADIINKEMDISLNSRFLKIYYDTEEKLEFTYPIYYDEFCVLAPKAQEVPQWMSIFLIFNVKVWFLILLFTAFAGFVWWVMKTKLPVDESIRIKPAIFYYIDICMLFISSPVILPQSHKERIFILCCLLFNLIIVGVFQGQLSTAYSTVTYYKDIDTLKDLDRSGLRIATSSPDLFGVNISASGNRLSKKIVKSNNMSIFNAASNRKLAVVERRTDATSLIELYHTNRYGDEQLHIVNECPRTYHLSYIVYRGYPFLRQINQFLERIFSAGLSAQWYHWTEYSLLLKERIHRTDGEQEKKFTILDVQTSFMFLIIGLVISSLVLAYEIFKYKLKHKFKMNTVLAIAHPYPFIF